MVTLVADRARSLRVAAAAVAVLGWAALVLVAMAWGQALRPDGRLLLGPLPPFIGQLRARPSLALLPAVAVAALVVAGAPTALRRWRWRPLLGLSWLAAAVWAGTLAASNGFSALAAPLARVEDYRTTLPALSGGAGHFLHGFVTALPGYSIHTRGHPPGPVLLAWGLERVGLPGAGWEAALVIAAGSSAAVAAAVTVRAVAGEAAARRALPFLVLAPAALWVATSMDALFLGVSAWGIALLALAVRGRLALALPAGLLLGLTLYLSYGLVPLGAVALVVGWRRPAALGLAALGVATVALGFTAAGFWWPAGVAATHAEWAGGRGAHRPYGYFLLADLALAGVLVGPATSAALATLRDRRLWLVVGAALLAVAVSDLGGFARGEVERIWLPFAPWLLVATAALPRPRGWLVTQAALALAVQAVVVSPW